MQHIAQGGKFKYKRNDDLTFLLHKADLLEGLATVLHIAQGGKFKYKRNDDLTFLLHKADLLEGLVAPCSILQRVGNSSIKEMTTSPFSSTKPTSWRDLPQCSILQRKWLGHHVLPKAVMKGPLITDFFKFLNHFFILICVNVVVQN